MEDRFQSKSKQWTAFPNELLGHARTCFLATEANENHDRFFQEFRAEVLTVMRSETLSGRERTILWQQVKDAVRFIFPFDQPNELLLFMLEALHFDNPKLVDTDIPRVGDTHKRVTEIVEGI